MGRAQRRETKKAKEERKRGKRGDATFILEVFAGLVKALMVR